jgi:hypothetical protein
MIGFVGTFFAITTNYISSQSMTLYVGLRVSSTVRNDKRRVTPNYFLLLISTATALNEVCLTNLLFFVPSVATKRTLNFPVPFFLVFECGENYGVAGS